MPKIIITADDLGIDPRINSGIIECCKEGILKSTALLVNAPYTKEAVALVKSCPCLEVGLHLSIVEGESLRGVKSTITDTIPYFSNVCLIRDWKQFIGKYVRNEIDFRELEEELELQIRQFLKYFPDIPFINGTQHIHLLPKVWNIVLKLAKKYEIRAIRVPSIRSFELSGLNSRFIPLLAHNVLGEFARFSLKGSLIKTTDRVVGMQYAGQISKFRLQKILLNIPADSVTEIVMHPGYESLTLRENLPWAYSDFNWDIEREALLSAEVRNLLDERNIKLIQFSDLLN